MLCMLKPKSPDTASLELILIKSVKHVRIYAQFPDKHQCSLPIFYDIFIGYRIFKL